MEKELKMPLKEYQEMVDLIKKQNEVIAEFKKESRIVLIDNRYHGVGYSSYGIPRIISADEDLAKEYLKKEFDALHENYNSVKKSLENYQKAERESVKEPVKIKKTFLWWKF